MKYNTYILLFVCIFSVIFLNTVNSQSCNCVPGWDYKMTITVTNNNPSAYTNIEVRNSVNTQALISSGKMKPDGSDIRFTDSLCSQLNYFIESGINTPNTVIWVKVPNLPANGRRTISIYYGNSSASSQSSGPGTFVFFEGFDNNNLGHFGTGPVCSQGTPNVSFGGGVATFSWNQSAIWLSDISFQLSEIYTAEAGVVSASGNFPGLHWAKANSTHSMAILTGSGNVRVSKSQPSGVTNCDGHNFIIPSFPVTNPSGIWGFTWISQGSQQASFPVVGTWNTADNEIIKNEPLRIGVGGITSGTGSYAIDWIRARKFAPNQPAAVNGSELSVPLSPSSCTAVVLGSTSIRVNWTDNSSNEEKFRIERSTDGGSAWYLKDSVSANTSEYTDYGLQPEKQYCYRVNAVNCYGISGYSNAACTTTTPIGIIKNGNKIPEEFYLYQNFPNPFNPVTSIKFDLPRASNVQVTIYDLSGREVIKLVNVEMNAGSYSADWNASGNASGIYIYRIQTGDFTAVRKMVLVK